MIQSAALLLATREHPFTPQEAQATWDVLHAEGELACPPDPEAVVEYTEQAAAVLSGPDATDAIKDLRQVSLLTVVGLVPTGAQWHAATNLARCLPAHHKPRIPDLLTDRPLRVGVDLDGVVYDWLGMFRGWCATATGADPGRYFTATTYDFYQQWGLTKDEFYQHYAEAVNARVAYTTGPPLPGAARVIKAIRDAGHRVVIVTARAAGDPALTTQDSLAWLDDHGIVYDEFHLAEDKTTIPFDVLIDDAPTNGLAALEAGRETFLFSQVYNHDVPAALDQRRVFGWEALADRFGVNTPALPGAA